MNAKSCPVASRGAGSFLSGLSLLTLSAVAVKLIGLAYRIPMLRVLGTEGMGYFNTAYEVYALLCVLSTAGLPVAMSVLISGQTAERSPAAAHALNRRVYRVALAVFAVVGCAGTLLLLLPAELWGELLGSPEAAACIRAVSPAVLAVCLAGAVRGYFQGLSDMKPTAVSQVIEALGKLCVGLSLAYIAARRGADLPHTAAAAVMGLTLGTAASALWLFARKRRQDRRLPPCPAPEADALAGRSAVLRRLAAVALPVTISAGVISLTKCIDLALILRRLQDAGLSAAQANAQYGCYSTLAVPVFNILPSLATSVAMSLTPTLSAALTRLRSTTGREQAEAQAEVHRTVTRALGLTLLFAVPAGLGLCVLGGEVLTLLFRGQPAAVAEATPWLRILGLSVPSACLITVTGAMLQAAGHPAAPVASMLIGTSAKALLEYRLLADPAWGLTAAPLSSLVCDTLILLCNALWLAHDAPAMIPCTRQLLGLFILPICLSLPALWGGEQLCGLLGITGSSGVAILCRLGLVVGLYAVGMALLGLLYYKKRNSYHKEGTKHHDRP